MLLRLLVASLPRRFPDLTLLLSPNDPETDFFNNIAHLQSHRCDARAESASVGVYVYTCGVAVAAAAAEWTWSDSAAFGMTCMWVAKSHRLNATVVLMGCVQGVATVATTHEAPGTYGRNGW